MDGEERGREKERDDNNAKKNPFEMMRLRLFNVDTVFDGDLE